MNAVVLLALFAPAIGALIGARRAGGATGGGRLGALLAALSWTVVATAGRTVGPGPLDVDPLTAAGAAGAALLLARRAGGDGDGRLAGDLLSLFVLTAGFALGPTGAWSTAVALVLAAAALIYTSERPPEGRLSPVPRPDMSASPPGRSGRGLARRLGLSAAWRGRAWLTRRGARLARAVAGRRLVRRVPAAPSFELLAGPLVVLAGAAVLAASTADGRFDTVLVAATPATILVAGAALTVAGAARRAARPVSSGSELILLPGALVAGLRAAPLLDPGVAPTAVAVVAALWAAAAAGTRFGLLTGAGAGARLGSSRLVAGAAPALGLLALAAAAADGSALAPRALGAGALLGAAATLVVVLDHPGAALAAVPGLAALAPALAASERPATAVLALAALGVVTASAVALASAADPAAAEREHRDRSGPWGRPGDERARMGARSSPPCPLSAASPPGRSGHGLAYWLGLSAWPLPAERARGDTLVVGVPVAAAVVAALLAGWLVLAPGAWSWTAVTDMGPYEEGATLAVAAGAPAVLAGRFLTRRRQARLLT